MGRITGLSGLVMLNAGASSATTTAFLFEDEEYNDFEVSNPQSMGRDVHILITSSA